MTEAATLTLSGFLLARIAEDEEVARAAKPGPWHWEGEKGRHGSWRLVTDGPVPTMSPDDDWASFHATWTRYVVADGIACDDEGAQVEIADDDAEHIARHDPARVLAECEAKRRIVERAEVWADHLDAALRLLALPYADHPDYDKDWRV